MAFCPNCGSQIGGGAGVPPPGNTGYSTAGPASAGLTENTAGALCYLFGLVTGIVFLLIAPYNQNKTVRFHAFQSIFGHIAVIVIWICVAVVSGILAFATHGILFTLAPLYMLLVVVLWLYMMYSAYNNKKVKLPVIGDLAQKQA